MQQRLSSIANTIARDISATTSQVDAAIRLLDDGATVPFIARYRKEITAGLTDIQLRKLTDKLSYLRELDARRETILQTLRDQNTLTTELEQAIINTENKNQLEDIYLPYRPKRRTKAFLAKEAGLEPLALALWENASLSPEQHAERFLSPETGIATIADALEAAQHILIERFAEDATCLEVLRKHLQQHAILTTRAAKKQTPKKKKKGANNEDKFADYYHYAEPLKKIPSHRVLAIFRGRREQALTITLTLPESDTYPKRYLADHFSIQDQGRPADAWLIQAVERAWKNTMLAKLELEALSKLRELAEEEAIRVFATNLRDLLLAPPVGQAVTMGLDPGIRTGIKVAIVNATGKLLDYTTVFPLFGQQEQWHEAIAVLAKLVAKYNVRFISIGNGTGSRETDRLASDLMKMYPDFELTRVMVSEAGASVYSASELATEEFPEIDVALRGAISIARRLQDPLAELVKIDPKALGVGQYQHDINQTRLAACLHDVIEDCVNTVGVDLNSASTSLLTYVAGLNAALAKNIVEWRNQHGLFKNRDSLKNIARMGEKTFQQAAGFLRIAHGDNALDTSGIHPETYDLVTQIARDHHCEITELMTNTEKLHAIHPEHYVTEKHGLLTIKDILCELEKPGRDPRATFKKAHFKEGVETIEHLSLDMILEGVVSNVTNFGAFVDIGVHQDGLVHISAMADRFVSDPHMMVKAGDIITVRVTELDLERRRIGLSMKLTEPAVKSAASKPALVKSTTPKSTNPKSAAKPIKKPMPARPTVHTQKPIMNTAMADALAKLKRDTSS